MAGDGTGTTVSSRRNLLRLAAAASVPMWLRGAAAGAAETAASDARPGPAQGSTRGSAPGPALEPTLGPTLGPREPFSFDALKARAAAMSALPYVEPPRPAPEVVARIDYDVAKNTRFNPAKALHADGPYPVRFQSIGLLFPKSVRMYALDGDGAREVLPSAGDFLFPAGSPMAELPRIPFAGFELRPASDLVARDPSLREHEGWASFLGGSYFRAVGEANQYGLSARGLAQDSGHANPEEFPDFTHFWIAEGEGDADPVTVYALLDGPSVAGAYRFVIRRDRAVTMEIDCELHLRRAIPRLGIAPLTSMYWFSATAKPRAADWRPAVHDSDGLLMLNGAGERLWRPLSSPQALNIASFADEGPRGFGLMQRDRDYDHYLDAVAYERRPCAFVEPRGDWGRGSVQLVEIPTDNEIYDNIVAMWVPAEPNRAGDVLRFDYRLSWRDGGPDAASGAEGPARCVGTRLGMGAVQGAPRSASLRKFMVEFAGAALATLGAAPEPVLSASRGGFANVVVEPSPDGRRDLWRVQFDLDAAGDEPVELRLQLRSGSKAGSKAGSGALSETWLYRYVPFASSAGG